MIYRQIFTKMWKQDSWFLDLPPEDKLLFIYLFSNELASVSGIYEIPPKVIAFETGLSNSYITESLSEFSEAGKAYYDGQVMWVVNLRKYNANPSPKVHIRIANDLAAIPDCEIKRRYIEYYGGMEGVSLPKSEFDSEHEHEHEQEHEYEQEQESISLSSIPPELITFLALFNRKRFTNNAQRQQAEQLLSEHRTNFLDAARWAASSGMDLGKALVSMRTALPKWRSNADKRTAAPAKPNKLRYRSRPKRETAPPDPLASTWAPILADLKGQMTQATFDTQLKDAVLLSLDDPVRIGFVSEFACANVQSRLHKKMLATVRRHLGADVKVQYEVVA